MKALTASMSVMPLGLAPLIVSALTQQAGLSAEQAGRCISAEGAGNLCGAVIVVLAARRVSQRAMATWALIIIMAGNAGCLGAASFGGYFMFGLIAGVDGGLATSAYGMLAGTRQATRNYAINSMSSVLLVAVSGAIVPLIAKFVGANSLFVLIRRSSGYGRTRRRIQTGHGSWGGVGIKAPGSSGAFRSPPNSTHVCPTAR